MVRTRLKFRLQKVPRGPGNKRMRRGGSIDEDCDKTEWEADEATDFERDRLGQRKGRKKERKKIREVTEEAEMRVLSCSGGS